MRDSDPFVPVTDTIPSDPLSYAVDRRDQGVLQMVRDALAASRTQLAFQPVVYNGDPRRVAFYEGLIRVIDKTGRPIPAHQFMPAIEATEIGREIDVEALRHGLVALRNDASLRLAVNMSARSIGYGPWRRVLDDGIARDRHIGERLILEITESSAMLMPEIVIAFMAELQDLGIAFALDDFGAGYTAFRYLRDFYFDILKIDQDFINGVHDSADNQVLVEALISIGRHFDMFTIAEGVETAEDAEFLASVGIDCIQGFYYGPPRLTAPGYGSGSRESA